MYVRDGNKFCLDGHKITFEVRITFLINSFPPAWKSLSIWNEIYLEQNPVICISSEGTQWVSLWRSSLSLTFNFKAGKYEQSN